MVKLRYNLCYDVLAGGKVSAVVVNFTIDGTTQQRILDFIFYTKDIQTNY